MRVVVDADTSTIIDERFLLKVDVKDVYVCVTSLTKRTDLQKVLRRDSPCINSPIVDVSSV